MKNELECIEKEARNVDRTKGEENEKIRGEEDK